jgi:hypothetical protein
VLECGHSVQMGLQEMFDDRIPLLMGFLFFIVEDLRHDILMFDGFYFKGLRMLN